MAQEEEERVKIIFDTNAAKAASDSNKLADAIGNVDDSADSAKKSMKDLDASFDEVYEGMKPLTARMGEAEDRLYELALAGETTSKEYEGLLQKVAEYRRTQIETDRVVDAAATTLGQKLGGAAQIAATGVQGVTAGMALFGDQSEETEKALLKVQAAMAFADSISQLSTLGGQFRVLKDVVKDTFSKIVAAKAAEKAATDAGTASQLRQNLAVLANPYVIAAAAVAALSIGVYAWAKANGEAAKREEEVTKSVAKNSLATKDLARSIEEAKSSTQSSNEIEILRARAYGKTDAEIQKLIKSQKDLAVATGLTQSKEAYNNLLKANKDYWDAVKTGNQDLIDSAKENQDQAKELYKASNESFNQSIDEQTKYVLETKISENEKLKQIEEKRTANQKSASDKRKEQREQAEKEEADRLQKIADEKLAAEMKSAQDALNIIEDLKKSVETPSQKEQREYEEKKLILEENNVSTEELTRQHLERLADIKKTADEKEAEEKKSRDEKALEDQKRIDQQILEQKKAVQDGQLNLADSAVGFLSRIAGKNKTLQKAAIIAESALGIGKSVIATNASNVAATAQGAALAIPTAGASVAAAAGLVTTNYVTLGLGVAGNIAATAKALQALGGGSAPSAGGISGSGVRGSAPPTVAFNNSAENQIGQSVARVQTEQPPLKVFVAESDISKAQNNVKVLENKNSF